MKHVQFIPSGVCSRLIEFDLDEEKRIHNLKFIGGCSGNLKAIGKLVEGSSADEISQLLKGNTCGPRPTSCADQLSIALIQAINNA